MTTTQDPLAKYRYPNLIIPRLREILAKEPIAIIPIGIMEWHGNHNALGMDGLVAEHICDRVMSQLKHGVLMPLHWVGTYGYVHYEGTICYEEELATQFLTQLLTQVVKLGFKLVFLISGHGGRWQQNTIRAAVKNTLQLYHRKPDELNILGAVYPELVEKIDITHAGSNETAMLWRIGQIKGVNLVDIKNVPSAPETLKFYTFPNEEIVPKMEDHIWNWNQIFPHPENCNPDIGEDVLKKMALGIYEELKEYCEEMNIKLDS